MSMASAVREHPILFAGEMVRAILEGRKTQTRRIVTGFEIRGPNPPGLFDVYRLKGPGAGWCGAFDPQNQKASAWIKMECPYGAPGDRLWVRETWQCFQAGTDLLLSPSPRPNIGALGYAATDEDRAREHRKPAWPGPWRPSIFMPRWASRLTLEIAEVRVQRLQEITGDDARAEGAPVGKMLPGTVNGEPAEVMALDPRVAFAWLWDSINGKPKPVLGEDGKVSHYVSYPWAEVREVRRHRGKPWHVIGNPWVWAITFRRLP